MSYNPSFADHQNLLEQVKEREMKIIKKEQHLERVTTAMFDKVSTEKRDKSRLKELRSGMDEEENENAETTKATMKMNILRLIHRLK